MSRQKVTVLACHSFVCLIPIVTNLDRKLYTSLFNAPLSRGIAIGN